ncbi:MAG TPA: MarR family transcriptional regulator [Sporichthyaceae bacterium]|jgi:DNA-binding MarR family transcriptional regulator
MAKEAPLTPEQEKLWRALMRIVIVMPRMLDRDLVRATGLTATEYLTLVNLSEAPRRELRMADLAAATGLSPSRTTRLVDDLQTRGLAQKRPSDSDGRGFVAKLTAEGLAKLKSAWPAHLASVHRRAFDHVDDATLVDAAEAVARIAGALDC